MNTSSLSQMFNYLVEDAFFSKSYGKVVVVRDDEKLWDVFAEVVLESELSDELIHFLYEEWLAEEFVTLERLA